MAAVTPVENKRGRDTAQAATGPRAWLRNPLPHDGGLDLLRQLRQTGYLEILSRDPATPEPDDPAADPLQSYPLQSPGQGPARPPPAARTVIMLDGDVLVQVSREDLPAAFWERHQGLVERRLLALQATLRNLTMLAIGGGLGLFLGLTGLLQIFETFRLRAFDPLSIAGWALHAILPLVIPAVLTLVLRLALRHWLKRAADRVFGRLRL